MTPATSGVPDPPAACPPSDRGAAASPATARMATRTPKRIDGTAVPPARTRTVSEIATIETSKPGTSVGARAKKGN